MKNENYFVIQGWMMNELNLSGLRRDVFALINSFSQDGKGEFTGTITWIADTLDVDRSNVSKAISSLVEDGLLKRSTYIKCGKEITAYQTVRECGEMPRTRGELPRTRGKLPHINNIDNNILPKGNTIRADRFDFVEYLRKEGCDEQHLEDFLRNRKVKRLPLTRSAYDLLLRESQKAGVTIAEAVTMSAENGWGAFKAEWMNRSTAPRKKSVAETNAETYRKIAEHFGGEVSDDMPF